MGGSLRLGKILGIEIRLDYSWFLVFFLMAWSLSVRLFPGLNFGPGMSWLLGIVAALLLFASVLVHEICHSLVARRYGIEVRGITLFLFGGVAEIKGEPESPKQEFFIAVVGPVASILIGGACLGLASLIARGQGPGPAVAVLGYLGVINIFLALFNLVPGFPLDGGRVLRSAIWYFTGSLRKATRWASYAGQAFGWLLIAYGLFFRVLLRGDLGGLWLVLIGWFLINAAEAAYQQLLLRRALSGVPVADVMERDVPTVDADLPVSEFVHQYLLRYDHTVYPVSRGGEFVGVVTIEDVRGLDRDLWGATPVGALAHAPAEEQVVPDTRDAWDALTQMLETGAPRLLVMHDGRLQGVVSRETLNQLVRRKLRLDLPEEAPRGLARAGRARERGWSP